MISTLLQSFGSLLGNFFSNFNLWDGLPISDVWQWMPSDLQVALNLCIDIVVGLAVLSIVIKLCNMLFRFLGAIL